MKSVEINDATDALKDYAEQLTKEPVVVTHRAKAIAALVRIRPADTFRAGSVYRRESLPDGTAFKAVWSHLRQSGVAKLVTVHYFDRG